jgi:UDP-hydrolysing UDP-N-acetyl-D-glucosamine 2-epimerase
MLTEDDSPTAIGVAMGRGIAGFSRAYASWRPDILVVLGDRFEMHSAALAALPHLIPVAHIHGGEATEGAIDDSLRHSITKLSHLHFASTSAYARRIRQMGEEPWRITVSGAIGLDNLRTVQPPNLEELGQRIGHALHPGYLLVTYHPLTLEPAGVAKETGALLQALHLFGRPLLLTAPNADTHRHIIDEMILRYVASHRECVYVANLGTENYYGAMRSATAMVGNSSSGIIEAGSFGLPVVNIGTRQAGRIRGANVIDCNGDRWSILAALKRSVNPSFRAASRRVRNPYFRSGASERVAARLLAEDLKNRRLLRKRFEVLSR